MKPFDSYFSNDSIYNILIKLRIASQRKRSKLHSDREISNHKKTNFHNKIKYIGDDYLNKIVPPRRSWVSPNSKRRQESLKTTQERTKFSLKFTYLKIKNAVNSGKLDSPSWYKEFQFFCDYIRLKLSNIENEGFESPDILAIPKKKNLESKIEYRPVAKYCIEDRIIIGLSAKYLVDLLDSEFYKNSFAFRKNLSSGEPVTHHTAFNEILNYKECHKSALIYVAECDIKKFYDCVSHDRVISSFEILKDRLKAKGVLLDSRINLIMRAYLSSFSFYNVVYLKNSTDWFASKNLQDGFFSWEEPGLIEHFNYRFDSLKFQPVGVPQGGALSCVISNIVLDYVDRKVVNSDNEQIDNDLLYIRYCDDMILMHTDKEKCLEYLKKYQLAINDCKLLIHEAGEDFYSKKYSKEYWSTKAKAIYLWARNGRRINRSNIPWVGFVGYQLRFDNKIRVRKDSLVKHKLKIKEEYKRILAALRHSNKTGFRHEHFRVSNTAVLNSFKVRLISLSVGRPSLLTPYINSFDLCWAKGFKLLTHNNISSTHLRKLDMARTYFYYKLKKILPIVEKSVYLKKIKNNNIYWGTPFSYYSIIHKK